MPDELELKPIDGRERRPDETAKAFRAFQFYLTLDADRSVLKVARKCAVHVNVIKRWSARYNWVERAKLFDSEQAKHRLERLAAARGHLADVQVRAATKMLALVEASLPRLNRRKLNAQNAARMFLAAAKVLQTVFGDEPIADQVEAGAIKIVRVETNVSRFGYDYSHLPADLLPESTKPKPQGNA